MCIRDRHIRILGPGTSKLSCTYVSPTLPDAAYDTRNQGRVVSHSELSLIAESLVTDAERSNRRVTCLLHIMSDVTRVRHAQGATLSDLRAFIACAAAVQTAVLVLFGPSGLGHYRPLQRRSASDKCSVRCRPIKQRDRIYRNFSSKPTFDEVHICLLLKNLPQTLPSGQFLKKSISTNVLSQTH